MLPMKFIIIVLIGTFFSTVTALECYECFTVEKCNGELKDKVVQCSNATAQNMANLLKGFYPNLTAAFVFNGNYQCAAVKFAPQGSPNVSVMAKGCVFDTKESLCKLESVKPSGDFSCISCNTNKCNSGSVLGLNILLMILMIVLSSSVMK
ncbi:uncharacterized protein LOC5568046 [Aedes aegypti]|nr:uncharacterized protein LOC5568046 [Aedes aegypti]